MSISRITTAFAKRTANQQSAFVAYMMAGDPDLATSAELLLGLPDAGADIVELGMPFSDPIAEGPTIQQAAQRALLAHTKMADVLALVTQFRQAHADTPLILMGYANPVHYMGWDKFAKAAGQAGVDGVIIVDLPPEESQPLSAALAANDIALIRLIAPTTKGERLARVLDGVDGFVYYVSVTGVTGVTVPDSQQVAIATAAIRASTNLPIAVGFGVRDEQTARDIAKAADGVVVGSAIVSAMAKDGVASALALTQKLADASHGDT
ncbi:Tryptophan synthase alpha chain [hydrothermal vent metagenome]|uniref:tryptophan synthase n=1 Tax=hydrothermal vent metagenome TaxID=652676 RepID=A0A3B0RKS0_9ZZZZ